MKIILLVADFRLIKEMLGLDLDEKAISDLQAARKGRENGKNGAFIELDKPC